MTNPKVTDQTTDAVTVPRELLEEVIFQHKDTDKFERARDEVAALLREPRITPEPARIDAAYREFVGTGIGQAPDAWRQMFEGGYQAGLIARPHEPGGLAARLEFVEGRLVRAEAALLRHHIASKISAANEYFDKHEPYIPGEPIPTTKAAAEPGGQQAAIEWSEVRNPDKDCSYHHVKGTTPFGPILITWKGWKDYFDACADETPWGFMVTNGSNIEECKREVEAEYNRRLAAAFTPTKGDGA